VELNFRDPQPKTPEWWLNRLSKALDDRNGEIDRYDSYYRGIQKMDFATPKFREAFGDTFSAFSDNWMKLVVDAVNERMSVTGFRYGKDRKSDAKAWQMWQANELDAMSQLGQLESLINGEAYAIVWPDEADPSKPVITIEHPTECIVEFRAGSRTKRAAALKRFLNDDGYLWATLYLPDGLYKFQSERPYKTLASAGHKPQWVQREVDGEPWPLPNRVGDEVPVVPLMNDPRLLTGGVSEIADAIPLQDAINKTIADMLVASEFAAAPQRYAIGFNPPKDENGNVLPVFEKLVNRLWISSSKDTQFGQFPQADLSPYVKVIEMFVTHFASRTRTPPHYFYLSGQFPSGEAVKSAETGLVAKAKRKMLTFGEAYEEVMRLGFVIQGDKGRSQEEAIETVWADPESRTEGEHIDATVKKRALGVPLQQLWEDAGYSPVQIERFKQQLAEEKDLGLVATPAPPAQQVNQSQAETEQAAGVGQGDTALPAQV
jgi:Phage portal protein, SPP1 Gp6-like